MKRCFISRTSECSGMCEYCFGKWDDYLKFSKPETIEDETIIYPNCDGDMFDGHFDEILSYLKKMDGHTIFVSISTKFNIDDSYLFRLKELDYNLYKRNQGMLKLSVSFSCESSIPIIEKKTATYQERIKLIKRIHDIGLSYITIIKPILPFIELEQYYKIIEDTICYSPYYILGGLYVKKNTSFYKKYIEGKYKEYTKEVRWNGNNGCWDVVEGDEKRKKIEEYIASCNGIVFDSDINAMRYLKDNMLNAKTE